MQDSTRRLTNAAALGGGELASRLIAFVATAYLAVVLGPDGFGIVGFALAVFAYVSVVVGVGFTDIGSREVAARRSEVGSLAASVTVVRLAVAAVCFGFLAAVTPLLSSSADTRAVLLLTGLLLLPLALDTGWVFKGLERGGRVSGALILRGIVYAGLVFLVVRDDADLLRVPLVQVAAELIAALWLGATLLREGLGRPDLAAGWRTFRASGTLIVARLLRTSIVTLDVVLLGLMLGERETGLYAAPYRICFFLMAVAGAIQVAYLPDVVREARIGTDGRSAARHLEVSAALGIPLAVGGALVAGPLIDLVFGMEYLEATGAFRVLLISLGLIFLFGPVHNVLLGQNRLRLETVAVGIAAAVNLVLNILWIPRYGILGAAWATLAAEMLMLLIAGAFVWPALREGLRGALVPLLASSGMGGILWWFGAERALYLTLPVGIVTYLLLLGAMGGVPADARAVFVNWVRRTHPGETR